MRRRKGFTLIELLVVIAIIGILAAMVFPVFARARESARKAVCLSNMKNIALAVVMYSGDWGGTMPPKMHGQETELMAIHPSGCLEWAGTTWAEEANPYLRWPVIFDEYVRNRDVYRCPSATLTGIPFVVYPGDRFAGSWIQWYADNGGVCTVNPQLWHGVPAFPTGWGGDITDTALQGLSDPTNIYGRAIPGANGAVEMTIGFNLAYGLKETQVDDAANFVIASESNHFPGSLVTGSGNYTLGQRNRGYALPNEMLWGACWCPGKLTWAGTNSPLFICFGECPDCFPAEICLGIDGQEESEAFAADASTRKKYTRHLGGVNIAFLDGHAAWWNAESVNANRPYCQDAAAGGPLLNTDGQLQGLCPVPLPGT
jgi:prepilin-type N-terminal cleavage/methylation domain-containing protein/prepilin-type processing-associated H-X9-DG protein